MTDDELVDLLQPHYLAATTRLKEGKRLVHYTSAENGYKILTGRKIWLRSALLMNDYSEIQHGLNCLIAAWNRESGVRFQKWLNETREGFSDQLVKIFDGHAATFRSDTYLLSVSEHEDTEDRFGRLSMWRAYGGKSGVALVMNSTVFLSETQELNVFSAPVMYQDVDEFGIWFDAWADRLIASEGALKLVGDEQLLNYIFLTFRVFALCTKHPGFKEEKEWRIFHSPSIEGPSGWLDDAIEIVHGVPQKIIKVRLEDDIDKGVVGVSPQTLLNRVIIGPCEDPLPIREAFLSGMSLAGISDPQSKIWISYIPLRHP